MPMAGDNGMTQEMFLNWLVKNAFQLFAIIFQIFSIIVILWEGKKTDEYIKQKLSEINKNTDEYIQKLSEINKNDE